MKGFADMRNVALAKLVAAKYFNPFRWIYIVGRYRSAEVRTLVARTPHEGLWVFIEDFQNNTVQSNSNNSNRGQLKMTRNNMVTRIKNILSTGGKAGDCAKQNPRVAGRSGFNQVGNEDSLSPDSLYSLCPVGPVPLGSLAEGSPVRLGTAPVINKQRNVHIPGSEMITTLVDSAKKSTVGLSLDLLTMRGDHYGCQQVGLWITLGGKDSSGQMAIRDPVQVIQLQGAVRCMQSPKAKSGISKRATCKDPIGQHNDASRLVRPLGLLGNFAKHRWERKMAAGASASADNRGSHLEAAGHECELRDAAGVQSPLEVAKLISQRMVDAGLAIHIYKAGRFLLANRIPFGVIFGGTDVNEDVKNAEKCRVMGAVLGEASHGSGAGVLCSALLRAEDSTAVRRRRKGQRPSACALQYFVCPQQGRAKYACAGAVAEDQKRTSCNIGGLSAALQNAADKPLMP
ncbi:unnamed protein product, partial [Ranitomeya imitator]